MVIKLDGVRWDPTGDPQPTVGDVLAPGHLRFGSGRAILSMLTGVVLDVEGPADVELISDAKVICHRGRIRARVPAGAEGFLVLGPELGRGRPGDGVRTERRPRRQDAGPDLPRQARGGAAGRGGEPPAELPAGRGQGQFEQGVRGRFRSPARSRPSRGRRTSSRPRTRSVPPLVLDDRYPAAGHGVEPLGLLAVRIPGRGLDAERGPRPTPLAGDRADPHLAGTARTPPSSSGPRRPRNSWRWARTGARAWQPGYAVEFWCLSQSIGHASLVSLVSPKDTTTTSS